MTVCDLAMRIICSARVFFSWLTSSLTCLGFNPLFIFQLCALTSVLSLALVVLQLAR